MFLCAIKPFIDYVCDSMIKCMYITVMQLYITYNIYLLLKSEKRKP